MAFDFKRLFSQAEASHGVFFMRFFLLLCIMMVALPASARVLDAAPIPPVYVPADSTNIAKYKEWTAKLPEGNPRRAMELAIAQMEKGKLPTEFVQASNDGEMLLGPLQFNPNAVPVMQAGETFDCDMRSRNNPRIIYGDGIHAICNGPQPAFIFGGDKSDTIKLPLDGFSFTAPGRGSDAINISGGAAVVVLEKDWGKKIFAGSCLPSQEATHGRFFGRAPVGGVGLGLMQENGAIQVRNVLDGFPAKDNGFEAGDIITAVNTVDVTKSDLAGVIAMMRGRAGEGVTVAFRKKGGETKTVTITRVPLPGQPDAEIGVVLYTPPAPQLNYIVFGPGIAKADIVSETRGKWKNAKTGDTFDAPENCFNFVFADE